MVFGVKGDETPFLLYNESLGVNFGFRERSQETDPMWVITRSAQYLNLIITYNQYSVTWPQDYTNFQVRLLFKDCVLSDHVDKLTLTYEVGNDQFIIASMATRSLLQVLFVLWISVWLYKICQLEWRHVLPEHLWISGLLLAVFFNQDPFYVPMRCYPHQKWIWYLSTVPLLISQIFMMTFWMLMVDGMALDEKSHGVMFYSPKAVFFIVLLSVSIMVMVENNNQLYLTSRRLKELPYVSTRFRQLSFRFFIYQSVCIILYFIATFIIVLVEARGNILENTNTYNLETGQKIYRFIGWSGMTLASTVLLSFYSWLLSLCYHYGDCFRYIIVFGTRICTIGIRRRLFFFFFSKRYFDLPEVPRTTLTYGQANLPRWFGFRVAKVVRAPCDTHAYVAISHILDSRIPTSRGAKRPSSPFFEQVPVFIMCLASRHASFLKITKKTRKFNESNKERYFRGGGGQPWRGPRERVIPRDYPAIVVAFRGTVSLENLRTDLDMFSRIELDDNVIFHDPSSLAASSSSSSGFVMDRIKGKPKIHRGFWEAFRSIMMKDELENDDDYHDLCLSTRLFGQSSPSPSSSYLVAIRLLLFTRLTGHSLGGALSTMMALSLKTKLGLDVEMYNFGAPRLGNHAFAQLYDEKVPKSFRIVMDGDLITQTPKLCCLYKHVGSEILLDMSGNFIINPAFVEKTFRSGRTSLKMHSLEKYVYSLQSACKMMFRNTVVNRSAMPICRPLYTPKESVSEENRGDSKDLMTNMGREVEDKRVSSSDLSSTNDIIIENSSTTTSQKEEKTKKEKVQSMCRNARLRGKSGLRKSGRPSDNKAQDFLHPTKTIEEKVASPFGHVTVYTTLSRPSHDDSIDAKISIDPILVWNGYEYDIHIDNIPEHLHEFFVSRQLARQADSTEAIVPKNMIVSTVVLE
eukprot:jgi/Bigna1/87981/estExt_fgenesh1_pg.C_260163